MAQSRMMVQSFNHKQSVFSTINFSEKDFSAEISGSGETLPE
jgi:hypothetical protein